MGKLYIAILYHNHQPYYKDILSNYYHLPWVRLHAIKDYYDMACWVEKYPKLKLNFNMVPSLITQLQDYSKDALDKHLELTLKPAWQLSDEDKFYILKNFFSCNFETMILPYKRYKELFDKRGDVKSEEELFRKINYFNIQDYADLQMWSNLVWFDPYWRKNDAEIKTFFEKKEKYTQEDKEKMVKKQRWICGEIIKKYKELLKEKKIEVTLSAFYHPILPLLCDPEKAKVSNPNIILPKNFLFLKEDAKKQIENAIICYKENFECFPKGFWPPEGSVSIDVVSLLCDYDFLWFASDEDVLKNSIYLINKTMPPKESIYSIYKFELSQIKNIYAVFRDKEISDYISFVYYRWNPEDAVKDIEKKLITVYESSKKSDHPYLVCIILDGENCWEFYKNDGEDFLNSFYTMLTDSKIFETVLISDYILAYKNLAKKLTDIWPGSWIAANYNIWIGHPEDNTAWEYLYKTREFLEKFIEKNDIDEKVKKVCWEEIYIAEGSDWFWWFGDEHFTAQADIFDFLFRKNLKNIYLLLGQSYPKYLDFPIKTSLEKFEYISATDIITPKIDGRVSSYFEWISAGRYIPFSSSMHRSELVIESIYFGFDLNNVYFRIDFNRDKSFTKNLFIIIYLKKEEKDRTFSIKMPLKEGVEKYLFISQDETKEFEYVRIDKIVEVKVPFELLQTKPMETVKFFIVVEEFKEDKYLEIEKVPPKGFIEIIHPDNTYLKKFWCV